MHNTDSQLLEKFKEEILAPLVGQLDRQRGELKSKSLKTFKNVMAVWVNKALDDLVELAKVERLNDFSKSFRINMAVIIVANFNSVLPLDYPFIVIFIKTQEEKWYFAYMRRKIISGVNDILSKDIAPILEVEEGSQYPTGIKIINTRFVFEKDKYSDIKYLFDS